MSSISRYKLLLLFAAGACLFYQCTTRRIGGHGVLLKKVIVKCEDPDINKDELYGYLKQKPNRKLVGVNFNLPEALSFIHILHRRAVGTKGLFTNGAGFPFYLHIHNLVDSTRELKRETRRDLRYDKRKTKYDNTPKKSIGHQRKPPKKHQTIGEFLWKIGEPPVLIDDAKTARSNKQLALYLDNKGYFHSTVTDTLIYPWMQRNRKKKAILCYLVKPAPPYTIRNVVWDIRDPNIAYDIQTDTSAAVCLVKPNSKFDIDTMEAERDRITRILRNDGYYLFTKDYVRISNDSALGTHQVRTKIIISKQEFRLSDTTWGEANHQRFDVRNIIVKNMTGTGFTKEDTMQYDSTLFREIYFLRNTGMRNGIPIEKQLKFKPEVLASRIAFHSTLLYRQSDYEATYGQLTRLNVFKQVVIDPVMIPDTSKTGNDKLDILVKLYPVKRMTFIAQTELTNTGGNFGMGGSFSYVNNNVFHGAEILNISLKGGTEAQHSFGDTHGSSTTNQLAFNTVSAGSEATLNIPREFFPFSYLVNKNRTEDQRKTVERRTVFQSAFNYQKRQDYDRSLGNLSYGYTFRYKKYNKFGLFPVEMNVVKVIPGPGLTELLSHSDQLLRYRFTDHFILDSRYSWLYNSQTADPNQRRTTYFKLDLEASGNYMRAIYKLTNRPLDSNNSYHFAGIPFSQYLRAYADFHKYWRVGDHEAIVIRMASGFGLPLKNYPTLPLEKSFYGGGANGIRAWEARSLGPGTYFPPSDQRYAQFGDIQIEYNVEIRVKITNSLNGAAFADGGNIWILKKDPQRPGADFDPKKFINDLAFGPGFGLRYDLGFFVVRLDWAFRIRDPAYPYGERWYIPGQRKLGSNLNFGIGYPF
ncbi:MAG: BamA/TamA family outer membrane protein [Bacteroidetes bacterium]|nr:BamA/TamA family outer membrane protein [Bacteroidota bacterium]